MSKPRMVIYIEDGILRDIIVDPEVDVEVLVVDEDLNYGDPIYLQALVEEG